MVVFDSPLTYSIVLIGFMGTGKTSIAKYLSEKLSVQLLDVDELIIDKMKIPITQIFEQYGEAHFREIEKQTIKELSGKDNLIISCGGGVCLDLDNIANIKQNNIVILLEATPETIITRVHGDSTRPLLNGKMEIDKIEDLLQQRKANYHKAADLIIDTNDKTFEEIGNEILEYLGMFTPKTYE